MGMMLGCSSLAAVRASRWKRPTNSLSNARENGSTLIATSRSSCFSRARNTMAIPPRPSSWRISYSSLSWSRTRSISVSSCWAAWTCPMGVVAVKSIPQDRQNLKCSSFWVPHVGQYIPAPEGRAVTYGPPRGGVNLRARDHLETPRPDDDAARGRIGQSYGQHIISAPYPAQVHAAVHARHRPVGDGVEGEQHRRMPPAEQPTDHAEQRRPALLLQSHLRVIRGAALEPVHLVVELGHGAFREASQRIEEDGVVGQRPLQPRARAPHDHIARGEAAPVQRLDRQRVTTDDLPRVAVPGGDQHAVAVLAGRDGNRQAAREVGRAAQRFMGREDAQGVELRHDVVAAVGDEDSEPQGIEDARAAGLRGELPGRDREDELQLLASTRPGRPAAHHEVVDDDIERDREALAVTVGGGAEPDRAMTTLALVRRAAQP